MRVDKIFDKYQVKIDKNSDDLRAFMVDSANQIRSVRDELKTEMHKLIYSIEKQKEEIKTMEISITKDIERLKLIVDEVGFSKKISLYERKVDELNAFYKKVHELEVEVASCRKQDELHYKMFMGIAERLRDLRKK